MLHMHGSPGVIARRHPYRRHKFEQDLHHGKGFSKDLNVGVFTETLLTQKNQKNFPDTSCLAYMLRRIVELNTATEICTVFQQDPRFLGPVIDHSDME